jgi:nuclease-like protein
MAIMHPESIDSFKDIPNSERRVFDKLALLRDEYFVYHSVTWTKRGDGECDFVIFHPLKGFIAMEVKGGEIKFSDNKWSSKSQSGDIHLIKDPIKQVNNFIKESLHDT